MLKQFLAIMALTISGLVSTGCYTGGDGRLHWGMPVGKDKIQSTYERSYDQVRAATLAVLKRNGTITSDDVVKKIITAKVNTHTVWVEFSDKEPKLTQIVTQARTKGGGTDIDLASEIDKQIYGQLITQ